MRFMLSMIVMLPLVLTGCRSAHDGLVLKVSRLLPEAPADASASLVQRQSVHLLVNEGSRPVTIDRCKCTISTTVNFEPGGVPPIELAPGEQVRVTLTGKNHAAEPVVRRAWISTSDGEIALTIDVPGRPG